MDLLSFFINFVYVIVLIYDTCYVHCTFTAYIQKRKDMIESASQIIFAAVAASQCYLDELMPLKCELMLLKCQINTITKKKWTFAPYKMFRKGIKYSYLVSIILNYQFPKSNVSRFFCIDLGF